MGHPNLRSGGPDPRLPPADRDRSAPGSCSHPVTFVTPRPERRKCFKSACGISGRLRSSWSLPYAGIDSITSTEIRILVRIFFRLSDPVTGAKQSKADVKTLLQLLLAIDRIKAEHCSPAFQLRAAVVSQQWHVWRRARFVWQTLLRIASSG